MSIKLINAYAYYYGLEVFSTQPQQGM